MKVGVTTAVDGYPRYQTALLRRGLEAVSLPSIVIERGAPSVISRVRAAADIADLLVLTSARAITHLWPDASMPDVPVVAVGTATAESARAAGGLVCHVGGAGAHPLIDQIGSRVGGATVVYPHAQGADPSILDRLRATAGEVHSGAVYCATPTAPPADAVDGVVFASPTAVAGWFMTRTCHDVFVAAIGSSTRSELERRGCQPDVVPSRPWVGALADKIAVYATGRNRQ